MNKYKKEERKKDWEFQIISLVGPMNHLEFNKT